MLKGRRGREGEVGAEGQRRGGEEEQGIVGRSTSQLRAGRIGVDRPG